MAIGEKIEDRNHIVGFKEEIGKVVAAGEDAFFTWFDAAANAQASFKSGAWDFAYHIAGPAVNYIRNPEKQIALEIGCGGGRLLAAASHYFGKVVGVDIHDNLHLTAKKLEEMGTSNFELLKSDGATIPVQAGSIDFVYSFIVFNHLERRAIVASYLSEVSRTLKPGGIAVIYFGRRAILSEKRTSRALYWLDRIAEVFLLPRGWKEYPARVNCTNIYFTLSHFKSLARSAGLEPLSTMVSRKKVPNKVEQYGMQHGLVLRKI